MRFAPRFPHSIYVTPHPGPEIRASSDRAFGFVMSGFFALLGLWPLLRGEPVRLWTAGIAGVFLIVALAHASLLAPLNRLWTRLGVILHRLMTPVVMGTLFFAILTPLAIVMRICGRDALRLRRNRKAVSYWQPREPGSDPAAMDQQY